MSYIIVLDDAKIKEKLLNDFLSGKECLILHKKHVNKIIKTNKSLDEYCLDYANRLHRENRFEVGDVITYLFNGETVTGLITKLEKVNNRRCGDDIIAYLIRKDGTTDLCILGEDECEKTGQHYNSIDEFMKGE